MRPYEQADLQVPFGGPAQLPAAARPRGQAPQGQGASPLAGYGGPEVSLDPRFQRGAETAVPNSAEAFQGNAGVPMETAYGGAELQLPERLRNAGSKGPGGYTPEVAPALLARQEQASNASRRSAFLGASDSVAGLNAVRKQLSDEAAALGVDVSAGGPIPSIRFLEAEIAKRRGGGGFGSAPGVATPESSGGGQVLQLSQQPLAAAQPFLPPAGEKASGGLERAAIGRGFSPRQDMTMRPYEQADMQVAFGGPAQMPSEAPRAVVDAYMRDALANKVRQSMPPLNEVAPWQTGGINIAAPRTEPGRDAMLAAFAAQGEKHPSTPGEGLGMLMAGTAAGTRNGQSKPGNSYLLGHVDPKLLPPLGSSGLRISGGGFFQNPGNFYG